MTWECCRVPNLCELVADIGRSTSSFAAAAALSLPLSSTDSLDDGDDADVMELDDDVADDGDDDGDEDSYTDRRVEAALVAIDGAPVVVAEPETKGGFHELFVNLSSTKSGAWPLISDL